jgi:hypothetical protein
MNDNNSKPKKPTIGESFKTQHEAVNFLKTLLPSEWIWKEENPQFFVDFHVEVGEEGEPTGFEFRAQVKGTKRGNKFALKRRIDCKHLRYYRDQARVPVFIILVDLIGRTAHWLFAQRYLRKCPNKTAVDKQRTLTLKFDPADSLNDLERFREALRDADRYVRDLYPGSQKAAASAREAELQELDPDINIKASFEDGCEVLRFNTRKELHYTFQGLTPEGFKSFQAMLDYGDDFDGAVRVTPPDSPLFRKLMSGENGYIHFEPDRPDGCLQIICASTQEVIQIEGKWRVGRQSIRFEGRLEKSPLQVELRIDDWLEDGKSKVSFDSPISLIEWEGQSVLRLASFDQIRSLVLALANRDELTIKYFLNGTNVGCLTAVADKNKPMNTPMERVGSAVNWLAKVRQVAVHYGVNAMLPKWKDITRKMEDTVEALDALAKNKAREEQISGAQFKILASPHLKFPDDNSSAVLGTMKVTGCVTFDFFGREITVSNVEQVLANMRLLSTTATPKAKEFVFEGQEGAVLIRRKIAA